MRVIKNGGIIAIGVAYTPTAIINQKHQILREKHGESFSSLRQIETVGEILGFFGKNVDKVFFSQQYLRR